MDIILIEIPDTNRYEQHGLRPALLLSQPLKEISIVIPFTTNVLSLRFPFTMRIQASLLNIG